MRDDAMTEPALAVLEAYGPDLRNGLTSHAPMVVEALAALGRADAVMPWLERYRSGMLPRPTPRERIPRDRWRDALGREDRFADWRVFFEDALADAPWRTVIARWLPHLAPAVCASAAHGVIRTGHAVRSLAHGETPARRRELAAALGYWAASHQVLPTAPGSGRPAPARQAITAVPLVPPAERRFSGTIVSSLVGLDQFPPFAGVIDLLDASPEPSTLLSDVAETFARVFLANAHDTLTAIVFVHAVTGVSALRSLLPFVSVDVARTATRYVWQASCALYAAFGSAPPAAGTIPAPDASPETLADMAIAHGDDHAIKFTEACVREHALAPSPAYLEAARRAIDLLEPA